MQRFQVNGAYKRPELVWGQTLEQAKQFIMQRYGLVEWPHFWEVKKI